MSEIERTKYLIIGNSAGGIGAAEAIREIDRDGTITIISDEIYPVYSRPLISEYLAERYSLERMLYRPSDFYEKDNIQTMLGQKVTELDTEKHTIKLNDGRLVSWEKLLLATGGLPIIPKMTGTDLKGVFTFSTLDDAKAIDNFLNEYPNRKLRVVVIGGGLIGVSVTEALVKRGAEVTIVEMKERILNTILDEEASAMMESILKQSGVEIITNNTVSKVSSYISGEATGVTLGSNRPIPCEMVIIAIGVRPRTEIVAGTGIKVNRGIIVDRHMVTSMPDIYACGDVAEVYDLVYGENRLTPIWPNAYIGGRVAGFNMAGMPTEYQGGTAMNSMKYFGMNIVSAGMSFISNGSYEILKQKKDNIYRKVILKDGVIVGMVFSSDIEKSGIIYNLMKNRINVEAFKQVLIADDFGLASLPEELWRPQLTIPPSLQASLITTIDQPEEVLVGE
jgi:NAD(P)H-nitrite reductase large subunit